MALIAGVLGVASVPDRRRARYRSRGGSPRRSRAVLVTLGCPSGTRSTRRPDGQLYGSILVDHLPASYWGMIST